MSAYGKEAWLIAMTQDDHGNKTPLGSVAAVSDQRGGKERRQHCRIQGRLGRSTAQAEW
jgi:hypothetical protein